MNEKYPPFNPKDDEKVIGEEYYRLVAESRAELLALAERAEQEADPTPADFDWLASQATRQVDAGYWDTPPSGYVWWEVGCVSFTVDTYQSDPGEPLDVVATDWHVDGHALPKQLVPETRGQFRTLCRLANT